MRIIMGRISNILHTKGKIIYSVTPDTIVYSALEVMFEKNISALLVMENNYPVGIFTERDYARNVELKGKSSREIRIDSVMTKNLITVSPDNTIEEAMRLMTTKFIRHLPVVDENKLLGIISIGDVVKYVIEEQKFIIGNLESYITGT